MTTTSVTLTVPSDHADMLRFTLAAAAEVASQTAKSSFNRAELYYGFMLLSEELDRAAKNITVEGRDRFMCNCGHALMKHLIENGKCTECKCTIEARVLDE